MRDPNKPNDGQVVPADATRIVRLDDAKLTELLDRLDEEDTRRQGTKRRAEPSYPYRHKGLVVSFQVPGGAMVPMRVPTRSISATSLTFLHGAFVYPGTLCCVQLLTTYNMWHAVDTTVAQCRYIEGRVYDVNVRFAPALDVALFTPLAVRREVLVVDDEVTSQSLISFHLEHLNAAVTVADSGRAGVAQAMQRDYDLILMDLEMPEMDGLAAVKELRSRGYGGIICAVTARNSSEDQAQCLAVGFNGFCAKPVTRQGMIDLLKSVYSEPLVSSFAGDPAMDALIVQFLTALPQRLQTLQETLHRGDLEQLERLARGIKGDAGGYGFQPITEAAAKLETAAAARASEGIGQRVGELVALCKQARPPLKQ